MAEHAQNSQEVPPDLLASPRLAPRHRTAWKLAIWLLVVLRLGMGAVGLLSLHFNAVQQPASQSYLLMRGSGLLFDSVSMWQRWDARWYQQIAQYGYHPGDGTVHFEPLYPLLTHIVSSLSFGHQLGGQVIWAGLIVDSIAFVFAMGLLYLVARLDNGPVVAGLTVLLVAFFPTGYYLMAPYTESLYLALSLAAFWLLRRGEYWTAGLAAACAAFTRIFGAVLALPLAAGYLLQRRREGRRPGIGLVAAALPGAVYLLWLGYVRFVVGVRESFTQTAALWGFHYVFPWQTIADSIRYIAHTGDVVEFLNLACLLGFAALAVAVTRGLPLPYACYVWPYLLLLASKELIPSPLTSTCRYVLVLFPCFIILARWLARSPWLAGGALVLSAMLQLALFQSFVHWGWVA